MEFPSSLVPVPRNRTKGTALAGTEVKRTNENRVRLGGYLLGVFVSIDPGTQTGWAIWNVGGLVACGLGDPRSHREHVVHAPRRDVDTIDDVWIEKPRIYPRSKARPADITQLTLNAGEWAGVYRTLGVAVKWVEPAQWKGQIPKDICHARAWAALSASERATASAGVKGMAPSKRHNVLDAVALGLWVAGRFGMRSALRVVK